MVRSTTITTVGAMLLIAHFAGGCQAGELVVGVEFGDEFGETTGGESATQCRPPFGGAMCSVSGCYQRAGKVGCEVSFALPDGNIGDFALSASGHGDLPWNELPWNAEAGELENAELRGPAEGLACGRASVNTASVIEASTGERYVDFVCADYTAGDWDYVRVHIN